MINSPINDDFEPTITFDFNDNIKQTGLDIRLSSPLVSLKLKNTGMSYEIALKHLVILSIESKANDAKIFTPVRDFDSDDDLYSGEVYISKILEKGIDDACQYEYDTYYNSYQDINSYDNCYVFAFERLKDENPRDHLKRFWQILERESEEVKRREKLERIREVKERVPYA